MMGVVTDWSAKETHNILVIAKYRYVPQIGKTCNKKLLVGVQAGQGQYMT